MRRSLTTFDDLIESEASFSVFLNTVDEHDRDAVLALWERYLRAAAPKRKYLDRDIAMIELEMCAPQYLGDSAFHEIARRVFEHKSQLTGDIGIKQATEESREELLAIWTEYLKDGVRHGNITKERAFEELRSVAPQYADDPEFHQAVTSIIRAPAVHTRPAPDLGDTLDLKVRTVRMPRSVWVSLAAVITVLASTTVLFASLYTKAQSERINDLVALNQSNGKIASLEYLNSALKRELSDWSFQASVAQDEMDPALMWAVSKLGDHHGLGAWSWETLNSTRGAERVRAVINDQEQSLSPITLAYWHLLLARIEENTGSNPSDDLMAARQIFVSLTDESDPIVRSIDLAINDHSDPAG